MHRARAHRAQRESNIRRLAESSELLDRLGLTPRDAASMEHTFHGQLIWPTDPGYETARHVSNTAIDERPLLIAFCETPNDVRWCLEWLRRHRWTFSVRAGGHSITGYSVKGDLVIDVSRISYVYVDVGHRTAVVGAGTQFGKLYGILDSYGLHVPGGTCESVAVGGYMQGGGWGFTSRRFGMNCDNVLAIRVMLANGCIVEASPAKNPDLFWAIRGGTGNNFGVLLEVTYQLHSVPTLWAFGLSWSLDDAPGALLELQRHYMRAGASDRVGYLGFLAPQRNVKKMLVRGIYIGSEADGRNELRPLLATTGSTIEVSTIGSQYRELNHLVLDGTPPDAPGPVFEVPDAWKEDKQAGFIAKTLSRSDWEEIVQFYRAGPDLKEVAVLEPCGGAINAYPRDGNAYIHRDADFDFFVDAFWLDNGDRARAVGWLDRYMDVMTSHFFNGHSYQNYPRSSLTDFRWMYWGRAFDDLLAVKRKYDPGDVFHFEQSISPYPTGTRPAYHPLVATPRFGDRPIDP